MTTHRPISASTASSTASFVNGGGTNSTVVSAPVSAMASATVPKTGCFTSEPSPSVNSANVPALRAFTPPTIWVPEASMRAECFIPSPPVMPWTMTLDFSFKKIDMAQAPAFARSDGPLPAAS